MEEVDIENADDLNELEARLYAQIHHEPSGDCDFAGTYKEPSMVRQVTSKSVINNKFIDKTRVGRYWKDKIITSTPNKSISAEIAHDEMQMVPAVAGKEKAQPAETVDKSFQPPVKNLSNLRVNPFASGNGPKAKGSTTKTPGKVATAAKAKNHSSNKGPFTRQMTKLVHAVKYDAKKQKSKAARGKGATVRVVERIELMSSNESEIDDVIEVPLPSPRILTVDSSSDDEREAQGDDNFLKPQPSMIKENSSRCTSPCSVMSDDFIGQSDRCRLQEENNIPDDEDLLTLQEDVDSLMENPNKSTNKSSDTTTPPLRGDILNRSTDYRVTQSEFRALDVYESESDIQESVYLKGTKPSIVVNLDQESSSDNDVEAVCSTQKTKKLRKRRASSTNKETVSFIDSTDSERENEAGNGLNKSREGVVRTRIPFIARGEALEEYVSREALQKKGIVNSSDNEFIATLNTLVQGTNSEKANASASESNDEKEEQITARAIAEKVVQKESCTVESADSTIDCGGHETNEHEELLDTTRLDVQKGNTSVEPVMVHNDNPNDALPADSIIELDNVFEKIDNINKNSFNIDDSDDSNNSVRLVAPLPVPEEIVLKQTMVKPVKNTGDPVYNIVYCEEAHNLGGIGWNEEMLRFYNDSWKGENFSVKAICSRMKTTKSLWKIYSDDRFPRYRKHSNQKCLNCCEYGHIRARCPKPKKEPVCYMCGEKGHREPRCPNTVCLRCGNKTRMFTKSCNACNYQNRLICPICKIRGHSLNLCPDKWRRYHSTTKPNEYPYNKVEYKNRKFCCVCGCRGHLAEHCRNAVRFMEYPMFVSEIRSHQKSYDDLSIKTLPTGIGYNLMYKPDDTVTFELAENKTQHQYYGRFLLAVGMGHLLKRKRRADSKADGESTAKQPKAGKAFQEYIVNPFAKAALGKPAKPCVMQSSSEISINLDDESEEDSSLPKTSGVQRNDPPMVSETSIKSGALDETFKAPNAESLKGSLSVDDLSEVKSSKTTFKTPDVASISDQPLSNTEVMEVLDSDSNYSFSEHFEPSKLKIIAPKAREMEPLPDFIPITDDGDVSSSEENEGISKAFISADTDDENTSSMPDIPCEAKIYLTNFHSKFLLSPEGNKFLVERSKAVNIKSRLDWTSVGYILIIFGLRVNQDKFHAELLHKFRDLSDKLNRKQLENSQKVPRKTEVLIRFLREHVNQLHSNLGNVNELIKRLHMQENQHTKSGWKSAEKTRRSLNMILIGQAGLRNGSRHLDVLLTHLRTLLDDFKDEVVPDDMRDDIDSHWKLIFSSYRHENYADLVDAYNLLQNKNRLQNTTIDPRLLGKNMIDTTLTKAQKDKMEKVAGTIIINTDTDKHRTLPKSVPNPFTPRNQVRQQKTPISEKKRFKNVSANSPLAAQNSPNNKKQQRPGTLAISSVANKIRAVNAQWKTKCVNLLTEINDMGKMKKGPQRDNKAPSMFWSREALKYIDECMQLGKSNVSLMEKMSRVQKKSQEGMLSYNDYRAIIKIHNAVKGKH